LRQIADAVRDVVIDGLLVVGDRTFRLFQKSKNHPECRRLARTVSPEETVHAAGGYSEIHITNCNIFSEFLGKLVQFKSHGISSLSYTDFTIVKCLLLLYNG